MTSKFDPEILVPAKGSMFGYLHENSITGLPLGMFWNFHFPFSEIILDGVRISPAISIDWMTWPIKSLREFDGKQLNDLLDPERLEVSFYLLEHQDAVLKSLRVAHETGTRFKVEYELNIPDLIGPNGEEWENIWVKSTSNATIEGFYIVPGNLEPGPISGEEAEALFGKYFSVNEFEKPFWDKDFRYTFLPKK